MSLSARRAWIEIHFRHCCSTQSRQSLSARRAWIEILTDDVSTGGKIVALRKESVDRNLLILTLILPVGPVALRKESVDRNFDTVQVVIIVMCRSPQGERG